MQGIVELLLVGWGSIVWTVAATISGAPIWLAMTLGVWPVAPTAHLAIATWMLSG
jgi:hypothetical protein